MKYIMKDGKFFCKEENATTTTLTGTLAGLRVLNPDDAPRKLQLDLKKDDDSVDTLTLRLIGDPALKILRCLYGIAEIIAGKVITIDLVEREGHSALINVSADGEALTPCGYVEAYAYDKIFFTDKCLEVLQRCFSFRHDVLVYANVDKNYPEDDGDIHAIVDYIRELRRNGRSGELTVKKTSFTQPGTAKGYMKALSDVPQSGFRVFTDAEAIEAIWAAFTEELEAPEAPDEPTVTGDGDSEL